MAEALKNKASKNLATVHKIFYVLYKINLILGILVFLFAIIDAIGWITDAAWISFSAAASLLGLSFCDYVSYALIKGFAVIVAKNEEPEIPEQAQ